jgi:hypothetical protein
MSTKQAYWFEQVAEQQQSGLTIQAFCTTKDIKLCTFHYWLRKYRQKDTNHSGFIELTTPVSANRSVKITYPNGVCIELPAAGISLIAQLLRLG